MKNYSLIRTAASFPVGHPTRRKILAAITLPTQILEVMADYLSQYAMGEVTPMTVKLLSLHLVNDIVRTTREEARNQLDEFPTKVEYEPYTVWVVTQGGGRDPQNQWDKEEDVPAWIKSRLFYSYTANYFPGDFYDTFRALARKRKINLPLQPKSFQMFLFTNKGLFQKYLQKLLDVTPLVSLNQVEDLDERWKSEGGPGLAEDRSGKTELGYPPESDWEIASQKYNLDISIGNLKILPRSIQMPVTLVLHVNTTVEANYDGDDPSRFM